MVCGGLGVLLLFIFRKRENLQDAKSHTIHYHWWLFLHATQAISYKPVLKRTWRAGMCWRPSWTHRIYHRGLEDRWCWASLFQKNPRHGGNQRSLSVGEAWVCALPHALPPTATTVPTAPSDHSNYRKCNGPLVFFCRDIQTPTVSFLSSFSCLSPKFLKQYRCLTSWIFQHPALPNGNMLKRTKRRYITKKNSKICLQSLLTWAWRH
jgi:hypothetical protein